MSTLAEIESAIQRLTASEREELLSSLDEAEREIDNGKSLSADDLRREVGQWAGTTIRSTEAR